MDRWGGFCMDGMKGEVVGRKRNSSRMLKKREVYAYGNNVERNARPISPPFISICRPET
jgi:hypothetical protein